MTERNLISADQ